MIKHQKLANGLIIGYDLILRGKTLMKLLEIALAVAIRGFTLCHSNIGE